MSVSFQASSVFESNMRFEAKRKDISGTRHAVAGDISGAHGYHHIISRTYFVTFQMTSGDRMEFEVSETEYGMLTEDDSGKLRFQGTRYLGFASENNKV